MRPSAALVLALLLTGCATSAPTPRLTEEERIARAARRGAIIGGILGTLVGVLTEEEIDVADSIDHVRGARVAGELAGAAIAAVAAEKQQQQTPPEP